MSTVPNQQQSRLGVAGFVLALLVPLLGVILSSVALRNAHRNGVKDSLAKAGQIIGIILLVLQLITIVLFVAFYAGPLFQSTPRLSERAITQAIADDNSLPITGVSVEWFDNCSGFPGCGSYDLLVCTAVDLGTRPSDDELISTAVSVATTARDATINGRPSYEPHQIGVKLARVETDVDSWCRKSTYGQLYSLGTIRNATLPDGYSVSVDTLYWEKTR